METHTCKTYFTVNFEFDLKKNAELIRKGTPCVPEDLGIFTKDEAEKFLRERLGVDPVWKRHHFEIGRNETYRADINEMIRITLKDLFGKEALLKELQQTFGVTTSLVLVPYIASESEETHRNLSPDRDVIAFLFESNTMHDMDYFIL